MIWLNVVNIDSYVMANITDPFARQVHGTNPQNLIPNILRQRIYENRYWKEHCFGLTAETLIDKAVDINYIGSSFSYNLKPTPFICLVLKLLQIQPNVDIILEYIQQEEFKYLRAIGLFYLRLVGRALQVYEVIEPYITDYRVLAVRSASGWSKMHMDEFVDELLTSDTCLEIALPNLPKRIIYEQSNKLPPKTSPLISLLMKKESNKDSSPESGESPREERSTVSGDFMPKERLVDGNGPQDNVNMTPRKDDDINKAVYSEMEDGGDAKGPAYYRSSLGAVANGSLDDDRVGGGDAARPPSRSSPPRRDRDANRNDYRDRREDAPQRARGRGDGDRFDTDRDSHRRRSRSRERGRERTYAYSRAEDRDSTGRHRYDDRGGRRYSDHPRGYRDSDRLSRDRGDYEYGRSRRRSYSPERDHLREEARSDRRDTRDAQHSDPAPTAPRKVSASFGSENKKPSGRFSWLKKPRDQGGQLASDGNEVVIEGSVEYWNEQRAKLGLKPLRS